MIELTSSLQLNDFKQTSSPRLIFSDTDPESCWRGCTSAKRHFVTGKFTSNHQPATVPHCSLWTAENRNRLRRAPNYAPNARGTLKNDFHSILASHNYVISDNKLNEFTFQYADFENAIRPTS